MIYLYDLIGKLDNSETTISVDNMYECISIAPKADKNVFLELFEDCVVNSIVVKSLNDNKLIHTHIYVSGVCYKNEIETNC